MARLKNTILDKTINRKALTFAADVVSNTVNTNLEQAPADTITDQIEAAAASAEQRAAGYSEVAEFAQQQDDALFCRLINNNVNLRYVNTLGASNPAVNGMLMSPTLLAFDTKSFNGGGMERDADQSFFTANKCGVYRVSFGMLFDITAGLDTEDFGVYLVRRQRSGGAPQNPYNSVFWQGVGIVNKFWACGSDLIELNTSDSVAIGMRNGAVAGISAGNYTLTAWIAINYTGNQCDLM